MGMRRRGGGWGAWLLIAASVGSASGQEAVIPPHMVHTVFSSDSVDGFGNVGGVVSDALGFIYVADFRNSVWRYDPGGKMELFADGLYGASGNAIGPRGYLYQSQFNANSIVRISRSGEVEPWVDEGLNGPVGIAANAQGELFVVNCTVGTVSRVAADRTVTEFARSELLACPNGLTFDDRGDLYVVNFNNTTVVRITPDGTTSAFATVAGAGGNGHITFARGAFYITKFRGNTVHRLERDGTSTVLAGTGAPGATDGPSETATFTQPNGITSTSGGRELWVNDLVVRGSVRGGRSSVNLRRIDLVTLTDVLAEIDPASDIGPMTKVYEDYHRARPNEDTVAEAITQAFAWMSGPNFALGVALMELNAERHPDNPVAVFNRGEAYRYTGQPARAAEQYRRVLVLQPDHPSAAARLAEVSG